MEPRRVEVERGPTGKRTRQKVDAVPAGATILDGDVLLIDAETGHAVGMQIVCAQGFANRIAAYAKKLTWDDDNPQGTSEARMSGLRYPHRTFGFVPPVPLRKRWGCSRCLMDKAEPELVAVFADFARTAEGVLERYAPEAHRRTREIVEAKVKPCWRFGGTCWTSGILNRTTQLPYHRDAGNFKGTWSAMIGARRWTEGGLLHLADLDVYLTVPHGSVTVFDGQGIMHGVTPIEQTGRQGFRYTAVLYARSGMASCGEPRDEPARAALRATLSAERKAAAIAARREHAAAV